MPPSRSTTGRGPITLLAFGHSFVDVYQGAVAALVPFFVAEREYSYAAASAIVLAASLLSSVVQPLFGVLIDRRPMRWLLPVSTVIAGVGIALVGVSDNYLVTLIVVAISGIGVAAYHPPAAQVARIASGGTHSRMGWFSLGGNVGFATAPLLVAGVIAIGGLGASPLLVVPALAGAVLCLAALRGIPRPAPRSRGQDETLAENDWTSFLQLTGAIICRSIVFVGLSAFISLYASQRTDGTSFSGTLALFLLYLGGAFGTVIGGHLANRWSRVSIVRWSYALTVLAVAGTVLIPGPAIYVFIALASAGLYVPFSLHITLGQDYLPRRTGTASGVTLGLTVSIGGIATPFIGALADATSLQAALMPLIALPAVGWLFLRTLREPRPPRPVATTEKAAA
jgi:FSR family fosmidomycin resistance protein-like MFS transporter